MRSYLCIFYFLIQRYRNGCVNTCNCVSCGSICWDCTIRNFVQVCLYVIVYVFKHFDQHAFYHLSYVLYGYIFLWMLTFISKQQYVVFVIHFIVSFFKYLIQVSKLFKTINLRIKESLNVNKTKYYIYLKNSCQSISLGLKLLNTFDRIYLPVYHFILRFRSSSRSFSTGSL